MPKDFIPLSIRIKDATKKLKESGYIVVNTNDIEIEELIKKRTYYRNMKDFSSADSIRNSLLNQNIILEDLPNTTIWRKL